MGLHDFHPARVGQNTRWIRQDPAFWLRKALQYDIYGYATVFAHYLDLFTEEIVARGNGKAKPVSSPKSGSWTQFVEIPLSGATWDDISAAYSTGDAVFNALQDLLLSGYRVSLSHNEQSDAVICSITCRDEESPNMGMTFNAFAGSWSDALMTALYKHFVLAGGVWVKPGGGATRPLFG